MEAPK